MTQPLRDIQFFRNSDVQALETYSDLTTKLRSLVTSDTHDVFKDGQIIIGRYKSGDEIRSVGGVISVHENEKFIDFLVTSSEVNEAIIETIRSLNGEATIASLQNGTLTLKKATQTNGALGTGSDICVLYLDTNMSSTNPLVSSTTVNTRITAERDKNYINSANYASSNPLKLTQEEITQLASIYKKGHIVFDSLTNRHYVWLGNGFGYPTVSATLQPLARFNSQEEILWLNDAPIDFNALIYLEHFAPTVGKPSDWDSNWDKYYLWDSINDEYYLNENSAYDENKTYFVKYTTPNQ